MVCYNVGQPNTGLSPNRDTYRHSPGLTVTCMVWQPAAGPGSSGYGWKRPRLPCLERRTVRGVH
jgi:hypothetical protein